MKLKGIGTLKRKTLFIRMNILRIICFVSGIILKESIRFRAATKRTAYTKDKLL